MSLRARLLVVLAALSAAGLLAAGFATYAALRSFLVDRVDRSLAASAQVLQSSIVRRGPAARAGLDQLAALAPGVFIELRDPKGTILGNDVLSGGGEAAAVPRLPAELPDVAPGSGATFTVGAETGGTSFRARVESLPFGGTVIVAAPLDDVDATLRRLALIELLVGLGVVAAIVGLGLWLVRVGLRPLRRIEETAGAIAAGDLSRRIDNADERTEVGRLGSSLNAMLGQIERAFAERTASEQRLLRFVADASHELRTPLSAVRAYSELFEQGAREHPEDLERAMAGIQREATRMGALVDDLLLLARLDQGRPLERRPVDLVELAVEAVDAAQALEPERRIELDAPPSLVVRGDATRLRQALDNFLANVRAHTPSSADVTVRVALDTGRATVEVVDEGPGLSEDDLARIFERFYRVDPSRSRDSGGSGLGLAIVAAIADAHGGKAGADSSPGQGCTFRIELPADLPGETAKAGTAEQQPVGLLGR